MRSRLFRSRMLLVAMGIGLGYLARLLIGPPTSEVENQNRFLTPLPDAKDYVLPEEEIDLQILPSDRAFSDRDRGLVPPISLPGAAPILNGQNSVVDDRDITNIAKPQFDFEHGDRAVFEPHGEQVCASGCALSRNPTERLSAGRFQVLMKQFAVQPNSEKSPALEELLYYGPQSKKLIEVYGCSELSTDRAEFLWNELRHTHARISLRVIDSEGQVRTWLPPTRVPFDRRHVFEMKTNNLQPLVTSGTVKRVGLDHLWVRL